MKKYFVEKENIINTGDDLREVNQIIKWNTNGRMSIIVKFQRNVNGNWETYKEKKAGMVKNWYPFALGLISMSEEERGVSFE